MGNIYYVLKNRFSKKFQDRPNVLQDIVDVLVDTLGDKGIVYDRIKSLDDLWEHLEYAFYVDREDVLKRSRRKDRVLLRHFFCFLSKEIFGVRYSLKEIGYMVGKKDHSTALHSISTFRNLLYVNDKTAKSLLFIWEKYYEKTFS